MIEFEVKSKTQTIGKKKGQTVYFAQAKTNNHMTLEMVCDMIVDETLAWRRDEHAHHAGQAVVSRTENGLQHRLGRCGFAARLLPLANGRQQERRYRCHTENA